jgi:FtsZ-binding cell division protein ZapB
MQDPPPQGSPEDFGFSNLSLEQLRKHHETLKASLSKLYGEKPVPQEMVCEMRRIEQTILERQSDEEHNAKADDTARALRLAAEDKEALIKPSEEHSKLKEDYLCTDEEYYEAMKEKRELKKEIDELKEDNDGLRQDNDELKKENDAFKKGYYRLKKANKQLKKEISGVTTSIFRDSTYVR